MSDILPQIEPETSGRVTRLDVPVSQYLSTAFSAGQGDSMLRAFSNIHEDEIDKTKNPKMLSSDDANKQYAVGDLKFPDGQEVNEGMAQAMNARERTRMDQNAILSSGATKMRFLPGMAARILGATANPVDFGSMFIPFVGEAGKADALFAAGRPIAGALSRGLITEEQIARTGFPMPKLIASMTQAGIWGGMADLPKIYESHIENQPLPEVGLDVLGQAAFAGILHGVGHGLKFVSDTTHEAMSKQAMNDFLQDKDISAHQYLPMDEHVLQYQAIEHDRQLRLEAANSVNTEAIKRDVVKELGEFPIDAALQHEKTGEVVSQQSALHDMLPNSENAREADGTNKVGTGEWVRGFVTNKGWFVNRDEADQMTGSGGNFLTAEALHAGSSDPDWLSHEERTHYDDLNEKGFTDAEAINKIRDMREQRRQQRILANPNVKAEIDKRRQAAIDKWVEDKKQELANPVNKETQKAAKESLVDPKDVQKYTGDESHLNKMLDEDLESMGHKEPEKVSDELTPEHKSIDAAVGCILKVIT